MAAVMSSHVKCFNEKSSQYPQCQPQLLTLAEI